MCLWDFAFILTLVIGVQAKLGRLAQVVGRDVSLQDSYDFVVAGGGTSGLTVADRLTEDPNITVLVIEYGPLDKHEDSVLVPGLLDLDTTPYWFNLTSAPQEGLNNKTFRVPAAAVVGGGTVINGMFFDRGTAADYDLWEQLGNPGWGWDGLLPYFRKSENFTPPAESFAAEWNISWDLSAHGREGPVQSSFPVFQFGSTKNFLRACLSLGLAKPSDQASGNKAGVSWVPSSLDYTNQTRSYSRVAHYDRVISSRPNYHLLTMHTVSKVLFSDDNAATGVEYFSRETGEVSTVTASKEVIIAAGAVHTPQILQLSGIGPKALLDSLDIPVVKDLSGVGHNLQDHPAIYTQWNFSNLPLPSVESLDVNQTQIDEALFLYRTNRTGAFTQVDRGGNQAAFVPLSKLLSSSPSTYASILALAASTSPTDIYPPSTPPSVLAGYIQQLARIIPQLSSPTEPVYEFTSGGSSTLPVVFLKSLSRGTVAITSTNASTQPRVDYRTIRAPSDIAVVRAALRWARTLMRTDAMLEMEPHESLPGASAQDDAALDDVIRANANPGYQHVTASCAMMPEEWGGVVDSRLRVYGVERVRIVDASIMPVIPGTHTSSTVYAVAEKAADIVKKDHGITIGMLKGH
ncbi:Glucose-methanol-choline oxidoreductase [Macrophomina phaseolina MS6]|uniref:Glucose-methanol-choline oxidoreductase n=1 Tax=Macrophomina phaseolina (strain MS6) TaxID=1126212 RepID=K2S169_MACPH|nr:Glucose-methanol-choline oxidoreductase [Macrophomina phaseolina MS6]